MKPIFLLTVLSLVILACTTKRQDSNFSSKRFTNDTSAYLAQNFVDQKSKYLSQKLGVMLNDLKLPVESYIPLRDLSGTKLEGVILVFQPPTIAHYKTDAGMKVPDLSIAFKSFPPTDTVGFLYKKNNGKWTKEEKDYYGKFLIQNILQSK